MEQLIINVEDPSILPSLRKVLESMAGVSVLPKKRNKADVKEGGPCMTKAEVLAGLDDACKELKLYKEGKIELKTLEILLSDNK